MCAAVCASGAGGQLGAVVINADAAAHQCYAPGTATYAQLVAHFGESIVSHEKGGVIDRAELGKRVFADAAQVVCFSCWVWGFLSTETVRLPSPWLDGGEAQMRQLTAMVWPVVAEAILAQVADLEKETASPQVVLVEAAALVEAGWHLLCDEVCWVLVLILRPNLCRSPTHTLPHLHPLLSRLLPPTGASAGCGGACLVGLCARAVAGAWSERGECLAVAG
jgi:hypothetical protein